MTAPRVDELRPVFLTICFSFDSLCLLPNEPFFGLAFGRIHRRTKEREHRLVGLLRRIGGSGIWHWWRWRRRNLWHPLLRKSRQSPSNSAQLRSCSCPPPLEQTWRRSAPIEPLHVPWFILRPARQHAPARQ